MWVINLGHITILKSIRGSDCLSPLPFFVELITFILSYVKKTSSKNAQGLLPGDSQFFFTFLESKLSVYLQELSWPLNSMVIKSMRHDEYMAVCSS